MLIYDIVKSASGWCFAKIDSYRLNKVFFSGILAVKVALTTEKGKVKFNPDILGKICLNYY